MSYIEAKTEYNRTEYNLNVAAFCRDLAAALGAIETRPKVEDMPQDCWMIPLAGNSELHVYGDRYCRTRDKVRAHVSIAANDVPHEDRSFYNAAHKTASATLSPDARPMAAIARDVRRRVIEASADALAQQRAYAAEQRAARASIRDHANAMKAAIPALDIRLNEGEQKAVLYSSDPYIAATMYADGTISIERIGQVTAAQFRAIVALLSGRVMVDA